MRIQLQLPSRPILTIDVCTVHPNAQTVERDADATHFEMNLLPQQSIVAYEMYWIDWQLIFNVIWWNIETTECNFNE